MPSELFLLLVAAGSIGLFHTLLGPDHYIPFIVMSKAGKWSLKKTVLITFICGLGHVLGSVVLGAIGIIFGIAVTTLEVFESFRGSIAAWLLITFGVLYFIWGLRRALNSKPHQHTHSHDDGVEHIHAHTHAHGHAHAHEYDKKSITPWVLFTIFVFGPCEPLIPLLMYPAATGSYFWLFLVTLVFGLVTVTTMMTVVLVSSFGMSFVFISKLERYTHALAGITIFMCGISIKYLGL